MCPACVYAGLIAGAGVVSTAALTRALLRQPTGNDMDPRNLNYRDNDYDSIDHQNSTDRVTS